jgi:hypothetical protein
MKSAGMKKDFKKVSFSGRGVDQSAFRAIVYATFPVGSVCDKYSIYKKQK